MNLSERLFIWAVVTFFIKKGNGKAVLFVYPFRFGYNKEKGKMEG
ncbi:hypothetical protein RV03_GL001916 [Enterococcus gallinarum]|nr:hypothetical protein RV03_GL001916 [Enterococcus gallinarum]